MLIGYERVSTDDQNLALQNDALQVAGCDKIFSDKMSGVKADRPGLQQALNYVRPGDTLVGIEFAIPATGAQVVIMTVTDVHL